MKRYFLIVLLITTGFRAMAAPQDSRPPLSKDEVHDLLISSTPSKVIISTIEKYGIDFKPTAQVLEEFRKSGADKTVLTALREAWHEATPKPLGDKEILMMLAEDTPSENIVRALRQRGIDFQPTGEYLDEVRSQGAKDVLIDALRTAVPRPFSKDEIVQQLTARVDQGWLAQKIQQRGIDFEPGNDSLQALRNAGAQAPLMESVRTAKRGQPFMAQTPASPKLSPPLVQGKSATLICEASDTDVPVLADPNDLGNIVTRLHCGEQVTFLERAASPPGFDRIQYSGGKVGFVPNSYLENQVATTGNGVTAPKLTLKPEPGYTPEARRDRLEGTVVLWIVIDTDGNVSDVLENSQPLGEGLDKNAIDTVKKWKFNPATRDGVPVAVRVKVEVSFRLYKNAP